MAGAAPGVAVPMTAAASPWIDALRRSHDHLAGLVADLTPEQLRAQSTATEWDVSQVLSHLGSGAEITMLGLETTLAGTDAPPNEPIWDRWNAMSPDERAREFVTIDEQHIEQLESLDDATSDGVRIKLGFLPEPIDLATAVGMRLSEHAFHSWDVFSTFDHDATIDQPSTDVLVSRVSPIFRFLANGEWTGDPGSVELHLTDPELTLNLAIGDATELNPGKASNPIGQLDIPAEAWLRLTYGRLKPAYTPAGITSEPSDLVDRLKGLFKGF
jgi:uncharacterized protein (TIGR03083 family)